MTNPIQYNDDASLRYRLHLLALQGGSFEVQPGYRRTEERMRPKLPKISVQWPTVDAALSAPEVPSVDLAWFERRDAAEQGERDRLAAARLEEAARPWFERTDKLTSPRHFIVSSALRTVPALAPATLTIGAGLDTPACLIWLGAVSLKAYAAIVQALPELSPEIARFGALMLGGQTFAPALPDEALETLLTTLVTTVIPPQHRGTETIALLQGCRDAGLLPEHPGEYERMLHGISRRRADRIHRAWLRESFALPTVAEPTD